VRRAGRPLPALRLARPRAAAAQAAPSAAARARCWEQGDGSAVRGRANGGFNGRSPGASGGLGDRSRRQQGRGQEGPALLLRQGRRQQASLDLVTAPLTSRSRATSESTPSARTRSPSARARTTAPCARRSCSRSEPSLATTVRSILSASRGRRCSRLSESRPGRSCRARCARHRHASAARRSPRAGRSSRSRSASGTSSVSAAAGRPLSPSARATSRGRAGCSICRADTFTVTPSSRPEARQRCTARVAASRATGPVAGSGRSSRPGRGTRRRRSARPDDASAGRPRRRRDGRWPCRGLAGSAAAARPFTSARRSSDSSRARSAARAPTAGRAGGSRRRRRPSPGGRRPGRWPAARPCRAVLG